MDCRLPHRRSSLVFVYGLALGFVASLLLQNLFLLVAVRPQLSPVQRHEIRNEPRLTVASATDPPPVYWLSEELVLRRPTLVAVVVTAPVQWYTGSQITAIHRTWAKTQARVLYFVSSDLKSLHLPQGIELVEMEEIKDEKSSWETVELAVTQYLSSNHLVEEFDWFLVVSDKVFVNTAGLQSKLESYRSSGSVYMGRSVSETRKCDHLTGVVYSQGLLSHLKEHLSKCQLKGQSVSECIINGGIHCTQAKEMLIIDENRLAGNSSFLATRDIANAVTVYPVPLPVYMYRIYAYFQEVAYNTSRKRAEESAESIRNINLFVSSRLQSSYQLKDNQNRWSISGFFEQLKSTPYIYIRPPSVPKDRFEVSSWGYVNQTAVVSTFKKEPLNYKEARFAFKKAWDAAMEQLPNCRVVPTNTYHKISLRGSEYIVDFVVHHNRYSSKKHRRKVWRKRVQIVRPFQETLVPVSSTVERVPRVNFIVTLSGMSNRLKQFLANFERNILSRKEDASLTIVLFKGPDSSKVHDLVDTYAKRYSALKISVLDIRGVFARGVGLHRGTVHFDDNELLFLVDIDLEISTGFLDRCRFNTARGRRVYFPIFYKLYKLDFVKRYYRGSDVRFYSRHNGHWAHYSYGMVCIYAGDYRRSRGFNTRMHGWGGEDVDFLNRVLRRKLEIFRAPDPGLVHLWHRKICDRNKLRSRSVYVTCVQSKAENLADRTELGNYVFEQELQQRKLLK